MVVVVVVLEYNVFCIVLCQGADIIRGGIFFLCTWGGEKRRLKVSRNGLLHIKEWVLSKDKGVKSYT